jgi:peptidoglycan/xylan/chitin deacetylase (PgdA/CDA1 family)
MNPPSFIISLDFELFWGVTDIATIAGYGRHVEGEWDAIPGMLALFRRYKVHATWATVGMAMCRDYREWNDIRPSLLPRYRNARASNYRYGHLARDYPRLFFARALVDRILDTPGQELASHTYSHFFCDEEGATPEQFAADMDCAALIGKQAGVKLHSLVLPRNQVRGDYLDVLPAAGIKVFRGNPDHWLYRSGHSVPGGLAGRAARLADAWVPLTRIRTRARRMGNGLVDVPASLFLRPWCNRLAHVEPVRIRRLCSAMTRAARSNDVFHLWWHPHNFGINRQENLAMLETVLRHYEKLSHEYGMRTMTMHEFAVSQDMGNPVLA